MAVAHRIYARALLEAAKDKGRLDVVRDQFATFSEAARDVPELEALLENPELDPRAKRDVLETVLADADELLRNFVLLTVEKGRSTELEQIYREFDQLVAVEEGRLDVELTTAYELSDREARGILATIEQGSGRKVEATRHVDPDLIGGIVLQAGSLRVDASVRGRLNRLRRELLTARN
jgi:F-type H+-transporting ATPase subunit delta